MREGKQAKGKKVKNYSTPIGEGKIQKLVIRSQGLLRRLKRRRKLSGGGRAPGDSRQLRKHTYEHAGDSVTLVTLKKKKGERKRKKKRDMQRATSSCSREGRKGNFKLGRGTTPVSIKTG